VKLDQNDALSVDATVRKLVQDGDHGVFIYKQQGVLNSEFPYLSKDELVLGHMTERQETMLKLFGGNVICMDRTHGTNCYVLKMTTDGLR
jgi:hypothetical protein